ncbi:MAG: methyltransferase [Candidatus Aenigmatarchaeota archaeon]
MRTRRITEGKVKLWVPKEKLYEAAVFYNPAAELSRDISVAALQAYQRHAGKTITVCDALSGTGIRGIRYAKEVKGIRKSVMVDKNPLAIRLIKKNIKENNCKKCEAVKDDVNHYLYSGVVFDFIDIDPFGSPNIYLDSAARSIFHLGFVGITATDTAPLSGSYPDACFRKYGIRSVKTDYYAELGLRILLSHSILAFTKRDRALVPMLCFADKHYFRIFGKMEHSGKIKSILKQFGYIKENDQTIGPIYLGKLNDKKFCKQVLEEVKKRKFEKDRASLISLVYSELDVPFYYDLHKLVKKMRLGKVPKTEAVMEELAKKHFRVSRTHFCPTALKTDASLEEVKKILKRFYAGG